MDDVGTRLRKLREAHGLSQRELARRSNVSNAAISLIENNRTDPSLGLLKRVLEGIPVSVTLVKPASVDTPFFQKARTTLGVEPQPVPPVYAPEVVAEVILHAAQHPVREIVAGGAGLKLSLARFAPGLADRYMERWTFDGQRTSRPVNGRSDNLYEPVADDGGERGRTWSGHTRESSLVTQAILHPRIAAVLLAAVLAGTALGFTAIRGRA